MAIGSLATLAISGIIWFFIIVISALPLYLAVKLMGGKASILKIFLVNIIVGIFVPVVKNFFGLLGGIIGFLFLLFVYGSTFELGMIKSFLAWMLQFVVVVILVVIFGLFGISLIGG